MEMKWGVRGKERERWSRLCWHGLASVQQTHTHTLTHNAKYTSTARVSSTVCAQMGYYSDVQLYSQSSSTLTALSGQLKATTSLYFANKQDGVTTDASK